MHLAAPAKADTPFPGSGDPHIPNFTIGFCPGGSFLTINYGIVKGFCDGVDYADGSFWHQVPGVGAPYGASTVTTCRLHTGLFLAPAPNGCTDD